MSDQIIHIQKGELFKKYNNPNSNTIICKEYVNGRKLKYIIDNFDSMPFIKDLDEPERILKSITTYFNKIKNGCVTTKYHQLYNYGRYFVDKGIGLQSIKKCIRAAISAEYYHDIDIKSCHPVLLEHICKLYDTTCPNLILYNRDRESYFQLLAGSLNYTDAQSKVLMLKLLNGGSLCEDIVYPKEIVDFNDEMIRVRDIIYEFNISKENIVKRKNYSKHHTSYNQNPEIYNLKAKVVNHVILDFENQVLIEIFNYFNAKKCPVDALIFDGLMVRKKYFKKLNLDEMLAECSKYVLNELGIDIVLVVKPMEETIKFIGLDDQNVYENVKYEFELNKFKSIEDSRICVIDEHNRLIKYSKSDFLLSYNHIKFMTHDGKLKSFPIEWLNDKDIRRFQGIGCYPPPLECPNGFYNMWNGFAIESTTNNKYRVTSPELNIILDHIKLLCNHDDESYNFFIKWLACLFQKPGYKNCIAVLIKTVQGGGKDIFYEILELIIGGTYTTSITKSEDHIFGKFNSLLENKILTILQEFQGSVGFKYDNEIKDMITCTHDIINAKQQQERQVSSFNHFIFFTNNEFPIRVTQDDRRLFLINNNNVPATKEYFNRLSDCKKKPELLRCFYDYLMSIDISDTDWIRHKPNTEFYQDMKVNSRDHELTFIIELLQKNNDKDVIKYKSRDLSEMFNNQSDKNYKVTPTKMGIKIKKYNINGFKQVHTKNGNICVINVKDSINYMISKKYLPDNYWDLE